MNNDLKKISIIFPVVLFILVIGCSLNAERDNPLDPESPNYNPTGGILTGKITRIDTTKALSGVIVMLNPGNHIDYTDNSGEYYFTDLNADTYSIELNLEGYSADIIDIIIANSGTSVQNFTMNALPRFDSVSVTSQRIREFSETNEHYYQLQLYAIVVDSDGVFELEDKVYANWGYDGNEEIDTLAREFNLSSFASIYRTILSENSFPENDVENMLNVGFTLHTSDINNDTIWSNSVELPYIISYNVLSGDPDLEKGTQFVYGKPTFNWTMPTQNEMNYNYHYRFLIYEWSPTQKIFELVLYDTSSVLEIQLSEIYYMYQVDVPDDSLDVGHYFWTIQIEDNFGSFTRSNDKEFFVQED